MPQINKIGKFLWSEFVYVGHLPAIGAAGIVLVTAILLNISITWDSLIIIYLIFYLIYLYNRFKEINIDYLTNPKRTKHLNIYYHEVPKIFYLSILLIIIWIIFFSNIATLAFCIFILFSGWLYTLTFKKLTKKIIIFKNLFVSSVFSLIVLFAIFYYSYKPTESDVPLILLLIIFIFLKALMMQIFFDVKDIASDKKEKLLTLPILYNKEKTLDILKIISIFITAPIPIFFSLYFNIFPLSILMLTLTIPFNFYCFEQAKKEKYCAYILGSTEFILWPILIIIGEIII